MQPVGGAGGDVDAALPLTAVIERDGEGYVATCPEVDVVSQGETVEQARLNLVEAVEGFFETASLAEVRRRLKREAYIMPITVTMPAAGDMSGAVPAREPAGRLGRGEHANGARQALQPGNQEP
jgi:predicted RNase H-like HicB family nuclease